MAVWTMVKQWDHETEPGRDSDFACSLKLSNGSEEVQTTFEYAAGGDEVSKSRRAARQLLDPYLFEDAKPPRRLGVNRDGLVSVLEPAE